MFRIKYLFLLLVVFPRFYLQAAEVVELEVELDSGSVISVSHYQASSSKLIVWLPSERGISSHSFGVADKLADLGHNVWIVDLHGSYMVPASRYSIDKFPLNDVVEFFNKISQFGYDEVYFLAASRGTKLVLDSIIQYSLNFPSADLLKGSILIQPNIYEPLSTMGGAASFIASSNYSHLPIYIIQPQYSTKYMYINEMRSQLERGGSQVFTHLLKDVEGGFFARPPDDLSQTAIEAKKQLPQTLDLAIRLLGKTKPGKLPVSYIPDESSFSKLAVRNTTLSLYRGDKRSPSLNLPDLSGQAVDLKEFRERVILINFWASWCEPCVKEIPSLSRLGKHFADRPFDIITVNIGESTERVKRFLDPFEKNFMILLDKDGEAVRNWRVYAFPSNYLIDRDGQIQYAYRGALEWDSPEVIEIIEGLL